MPQTLAARYLSLLAEAQEVKCGSCFAWHLLRAWGACEVFCLACGATARIADTGARLVATWTAGTGGPT